MEVWLKELSFIIFIVCFWANYINFKYEFRDVYKKHQWKPDEVELQKYV